MLCELKIQNFAIIDNLTVEFHPGLNILTGETGAGKSILIHALNLILGGRADADFIRSGQTSATVDAVFIIKDLEILAFIRNLGIEVENNSVIIKRVVSDSGKSRCFLNDSNLTVSSLAKIGARLVDIHGQHDHQALLNPEIHVDVLDLYGNTVEVRQRFADEYRDYQEDLNRLKSMRTSEQERLQREDLLQFQISEIDRADLSVDEEESLLTEKNKLRHAEKLSQNLEQVQQLLTESDNSALNLLASAGKLLEALVEIDPSLERQNSRRQSAYYEVEELREELRDYLNSVEFRPDRLEEIEDRLADINGLKRKYGPDIEAVLAYREKISAELTSFSSHQETVDALQKQIGARQKALAKLSIELAEKREHSAKILNKKVEKELRELSLPKVRFSVRFDYRPDPDSFVSFRGQPTPLTGTGLGAIEFLFSPNPGEALRPLAKIASGGELSRLMLGLKTILHKQDAIASMVFDEVDTGIGGKVAERVGAKLEKLAKEKQVFCITHLPQIAGRASEHFLVHKQVKGKRTYASIRKLNYAERVEEVARMSGGEKITDATIQHAREMVKK